MKLYVGITDSDWYNIVKEERCDEVNFWKPGNANFRALQENELFLFKLHAPQNFIVGGGFFVRFSQLPIYLAWDAFGTKNGTKTLDQLYQRIEKYRSRNNMVSTNPMIGCIILTDPFFFEKEDWIPVPKDWNGNIVQGKTYDTSTKAGQLLNEEVRERLSGRLRGNVDFNNLIISQYSEYQAKHRLGQGAFRISVADAYQRRCAITGEKTLPVLEAAHIKPYAENGPHSVSNGILLKSDFHTLFDKGYITIDTDYRIDVSARLNEDYGNGKDYYKYHGSKMLILPASYNEQPSKEYLEWHNNNVFLG